MSKYTTERLIAFLQDEFGLEGLYDHKTVNVDNNTPRGGVCTCALCSHIAVGDRVGTVITNLYKHISDAHLVIEEVGHWFVRRAPSACQGFTYGTLNRLTLCESPGPIQTHWLSCNAGEAGVPGTTPGW